MPSMVERWLSDVNRSVYSLFRAPATCARPPTQPDNVVTVESMETSALVKQLQNPGLWRAALFAMLLPLSLVAFWPSPVDQPIEGQLSETLRFLHAHGIPNWFSYKFVEAAANVALFIPLGMVSALAFPEKRWWRIGALGLLISGCMEAGQLLFLHNRFASPLDLVTNTVGTVIGALLASAALRRHRGADFDRLSHP